MLVTSFIKRESLENRKKSIKEKIIKFMHFVDRPVLIGELALESRETLDLVEACVHEMCTESDPRIRQLSEFEIVKFQKHHNHWFILTTLSSLKIARS